MKTLIICILPLCLLCMAGCDDNNSLHQKYIDAGETIYTGMIDSVKVTPGNGRALFSWWINADPRIDRTLIYWNEGADSASVPVNRTRSGAMKIEAELKVPENTYIFKLVTKDDAGHQSKGVNATVQVYGQQYIRYLMNRLLQSQSISAENALTLKWYATESASVQYATVHYTDYTNPANPAPASVRVENDDMQTVIPEVRSGDTFQVTTTYLPAGGVDMVDALPTEYTIR